MGVVRLTASPLPTGALMVQTLIEQFRWRATMHSYIFWALLGMAGYSFGTFFVSLSGAAPLPLI